MRNFGLIFLLFSVVQVVHAQQPEKYSALIQKAVQEYTAKNYKASSKLFAQAFEVSAGQAVDYYNAACVESLLKKKNKAFVYLAAALDKGYNNIEHIQTDSDLFLLHPESEWKQVLERTKKNREKSSSEFRITSDVKRFILQEKPESIFALGTEEYRTKNSVDDIKNFIDEVKESLRLHKQSDFSDFIITNSSSSETVNGLLTQRASQKLWYLPRFFGNNTSEMFVQVSIRMLIEAKKVGDEWKLENVTFDNAMLSSNFDWQRNVRQYLADVREGSVKIVTKNSTKSSQITLEAHVIRADVMDALASIRVDSTETNPFISENGMGILFKKLEAIPKDEHNFGDFVALLNGNKKTKLLEILFSPESKKIVISTGDRYGFYVDENDAVARLIGIVRKNSALD